MSQATEHIGADFRPVGSHEEQLKAVNAHISEINAKLAELTKAREAIDNGGDKERIAAKIAGLKRERERAIATGKAILQAAQQHPRPRPSRYIG
jgi:hypothetical protein